MKAIKVFIDKSETIKMVEFIPQINQEENIAAMIVNPDEFCVAATSETAMAWAKAVIISKFDDCSIEVIK